ncbi:MAG: hypothetical protein V4549_03505 [Bacteroidota bacterium]
MKKFFRKLILGFLIFSIAAQSVFAVDNPNYWKKSNNTILLTNPAWSLSVPNISFSGDQTFDGNLTVDQTNANAFLVRKNNDGGDVFNIDTATSTLSSHGSATFKGSIFDFTGFTAVVSAPTVALISPAAAGNVDNGDHRYKTAFTKSAFVAGIAGPASSTVTVANKTINGKVKLTNIEQPTDPEIDLIYIYRDNNADGVFVFVDSIPVGTTTYTDNISNATIDGNDTTNDQDSSGSVNVSGFLQVASGSSLNGITFFGDLINAISAKIIAGSDAAGLGTNFDFAVSETDFSNPFTGSTGSSIRSMNRNVYNVIPSANIVSPNFVETDYTAIKVPSSNSKNIYSLTASNPEMFYQGTGTLHQGQALDVEAYNAGAGTATSLDGIGVFSVNSGIGTTGWNAAGYFAAYATAGSITSNYGLYIDSSIGTITSNYGLFIGSQTAGSSVNRAIVTGLGPVEFGDRILGKSVGVTAANNLTLGAGNENIVSGNTQINAITTANWTAGSKVTLIFLGTPTIKHNTAGGAGTAKILLAGSGDIVAAANTVLQLEFDGTQWQEISRKAA